MKTKMYKDSVAGNLKDEDGNASYWPFNAGTSQGKDLQPAAEGINSLSTRDVDASNAFLATKISYIIALFLSDVI